MCASTTVGSNPTGYTLNFYLMESVMDLLLVHHPQYRKFWIQTNKFNNHVVITAFYFNHRGYRIFTGKVNDFSFETLNNLLDV